MIQIQKNKVLAEFLNIDFDKLKFSQQLDWGYDWNNLMEVAIKLDFDKHQLSLDQETLFENCLYFIKEIEKDNVKRLCDGGEK